jgi:hypothetical protein
MPSFTIRVPGLHQTGPQLQIAIGLQPAAEQAVRDAGDPLPAPVALPCMIDTGATLTIIAQGTGAKLGLKPVGVVTMSTASHKGVPCEQYAVRLAMPNNIIIDITATEMPMPDPSTQALIGRDILSQCVLVYVGYAETFTLSI